MKFYAGIGSRQTPPDILEFMEKVAIKLDSDGYILRSGGAEGADRAFERGVSNPNKKQIFYAKHAPLWAFDEVKKYIPTDRSGFDGWSPYVRKLLARNMCQILGENGDSPVEFVVCWTPSTVYTDSSAGGTAYAIRCALAYNIPVYNFVIPNVLTLWQGTKLGGAIIDNRKLLEINF
jgi:hypothetical protein